MPSSMDAPDSKVQSALLALQIFQVLFLWLHDWIPFGRLNDVAAVRAQDTMTRLVGVTLVQSVPFTIGLFFSLLYFSVPEPKWLRDYLWISYTLLFLGQINAWWIPYLIREDKIRAARYEILFSKTYTFLPRRNGIVPNTLHVLLHISTAATLLVLLVR